MTTAPDFHSYRHLAWEGCLNARDLGGLPTIFGRQTLPGRLVRSDTPGRLSSFGRRALTDYGIRTIIDLRHPEEARREPHEYMRSRSPITYQNLPLEKYYPHVSARISRAASRGEVYCIIADHYPDLTADVLRAIAYAQPGGVLVHCHSGKDRTGIIAALALRLAGVAASEVVRDYALSQERLLAAGDSTPVEENEKAPDDFWSRPTAGPEMMAMLLDHLDMAYGSVPGYLAHAGLMPEDMNALKVRLLSA